jgi:hypothetical protein
MLSVHDDDIGLMAVLAFDLAAARIALRRLVSLDVAIVVLGTGLARDLAKRMVTVPMKMLLRFRGVLRKDVVNPAVRDLMLAVCVMGVGHLLHLSVVRDLPRRRPDEDLFGSARGVSLRIGIGLLDAGNARGAVGWMLAALARQGVELVAVRCLGVFKMKVGHRHLLQRRLMIERAARKDAERSAPCRSTASLIVATVTAKLPIRRWQRIS